MNLGAHYQLVKSIFEASSNFNNKKPRVKRAKEKSMNKHDSVFSYIKQAHPTIFSKVPIFALMSFFTEKVAKWKVVTLHKCVLKLEGPIKKFWDFKGFFLYARA